MKEETIMIETIDQAPNEGDSLTECNINYIDTLHITIFTSVETWDYK